MAAIDELGFERPTQIQAEAIPQALDGRDILPARPPVPENGGPGRQRCNIWIDFRVANRGRPHFDFNANTRTGDGFADQGAHWRSTPNSSLPSQVALSEHADILSTTRDIVVATPGRLMEHSAERFNCRAIEWLILDEADRMLDVGCPDRGPPKNVAGVNRA